MLGKHLITNKKCAKPRISISFLLCLYIPFEPHQYSIMIIWPFPSLIKSNISMLRLIYTASIYITFLNFYPQSCIIIFTNVMNFIVGSERSQVCVCMTHVALPGTNYAMARDVDISTRASRILWFWLSFYSTA